MNIVSDANRAAFTAVRFVSQMNQTFYNSNVIVLTEYTDTSNCHVHYLSLLTMRELTDVASKPTTTAGVSCTETRPRHQVTHLNTTARVELTLKVPVSLTHTLQASIEGAVLLKKLTRLVTEEYLVMVYQGHQIRNPSLGTYRCQWTSYSAAK